MSRQIAPDPSIALDAEPASRWAGPSRWRSAREAGVYLFLLACAAITVLTTAGIVVVLGVQAAAFFSRPDVSAADFWFGTVLDRRSHPPRFGILPLAWGTLVIALGSSLIALPVGLLSAIYLSEYAHRRVRAVLKPTLELLAGIPTIVYGYLALLLVTPALKAVFGRAVESYNALSACIVVGIMIIPMVSSLSEDVLSAVPRGLREAGYGLGATKFEVSTRIVLPAGLSGVVASFILAVSRAIGETMAVVLAAGIKPQITLDPLKSIETMTAYIVALSTGEAPPDSTVGLSLFAVGSALFLITLALNIASGFVLRRYREAYQ